MCLMSIAALYLLIGAEFLGVTQIMIYAGGVLVLIIFGIMLTSRLVGKSLEVGNRNILSGTVVSLGLLILTCWSLSQSVFSSSLTQTSSRSNLEQMGILLMSDYVLPFEIAGLLLLISLIGAAVTASLMKRKNA